MIKHPAFKRGIPPEGVLQNKPNITLFLRGVLASNRSEDNWESNNALETCYRKGWIQAELSGDEPQKLGDPKPKTVYVFSSTLHRR